MWLVSVCESYYSIYVIFGECVCMCIIFFFFKQKTAYEMRISDWSSDVCSSDLHDFSNKAGVVHSEIMLPDGAPERLNDRATLWNEVEGAEKRKDAQLAREVEFSIPRELNQQQGIQLAREFVEKQFVERGMVADMNVHWDMGQDGQPKPHAHVMLSMREVGPEGFGQKVREWNSTALLQEWREAWADHV